MPPLEIGPGRPVGPVQVALTAAAPGRQGESRKIKTESAAASQVVERSDALDPGAAPVDMERVAQIRHAVEKGTYPVIPTKIADAMIAAGMLLRRSEA